jgi:ATP-dependent RNA helicase DeaD
MTDIKTLTFAELGLPEKMLKAIAAVGYETPSPIQAETIPPLLQGRDVLGQAQTGTGKTAAFALPILAKMDLSRKGIQALVLTPTRELAIQVAEAFQTYASQMPGFHVLPIYGGQSYGPQLKGLQRGAHVVVGTPGRVQDHIDRGSLDLSKLTNVVLDEADEMLRMGFQEAVESILTNTPKTRQVALFSATMPRPIARIAETHLKDPVRISIEAKTQTASSVRQRYWFVSGLHKLDALTRILEAEAFEAMIVFTRTKLGTEELADKLTARGFSAAAINGDVVQALRERLIQRLKDGSLDILVATDVAARGLDVDRISHVINYDIPVDTESYVHRIGRTGRAGKSGDAILFVTPREKGLLRAIERTTRQTIEPMQLPSASDVNDIRISRFKQKIVDTMSAGGLEGFQGIVDSLETEKNIPAREIAAALAKLANGDKPLLLKGDADVPMPAYERADRPERTERPDRGERPARFERTDRTERTERAPRAARFDEDDAPRKASGPRSDVDKESFKLAVGRMHDVKPGQIVGAIANEAGLESQHIGKIDIFEDYTLIDLPKGMPAEVFQHLKRTRVAGQALHIEKWDGKHTGSGASDRPAPRKFERSEGKAKLNYRR